MRNFLGILCFLFACGQPSPPAAENPVSAQTQKTSSSETTASSAPAPGQKDPKNPCADKEGTPIQVPSSQGAEKDPELLAYSTELVPLLEKVRGITPTTDVRMSWVTQKGVCLYLLDEMEKQTTPEERVGQEHALKVLGLIPESADLEALFVSLMTEQAAGFYDPRQKTLFVARWMPTFMQKPILAHEMYHALQDQYLDLKEVLFEEENDDAKSAHSALFEGDGTLLMLLMSIAGKGDLSPEVMKQVLARFSSSPGLMRSQVSSMNALSPVFASAPKALQETVLFPYIEGLSFVLYGAKDGSFAKVDAAYRDLPSSTEQILHPEKYFDSRDQPSLVVLPEKIEATEDFKEVYKGTLGEFTLRLALGAGDPRSEGAEAASGWDGDQYRVYVKKEGEATRRAVVMVLAWDDEAGAVRVKEALLRVFSDAAIESKAPNLFAVAWGFGDKNAQVATQALAAEVTMQ